MKNKILSSNDVKELARTKKERRRQLARLPFEEKILILVQLQKLASDISRTVKGIGRRPWDISSSS